MSGLTFINITVWSPEQVTNWLKGLDDAIQPYIDNFMNQKINGKKLLELDHQDLDKLGIEKLGHQELILEAIDLLFHVQYTLENETIQSLALKLGCQAKCVCNDLKVHDKKKGEKLPMEVLSGIANTMGHVKSLVSWFDRAPFDGSDEYIKTRNSLVKLGMDIIAAIQGDNVFDNTESVKVACLELCSISEHLIQDSKDTLTIQPAWLDIATVRKKPEEELGMHIQSSYNGTHTIGGIKEESPAHQCGKVEEGDEVIMVNYQMVVGWQLKKLVNTLKENKKEVILTLKKRPCHVDLFGNKPHKKKRVGNKLQPGTYPGKARSRRSRKSRRSPLQLPINTEPNTEALSDSMKEVESENDALDDNDNVFRSGSESPAFQHLRTFEDVKQRRATVSGGSPTVKRPSIMISDSDTPRPKSYTLALSSPGSEDFSSYSFDLNSLDLGSPASEVTTSPPTDSDTGSKVLSPPLSGNNINKLKTNSSPMSSGGNNSPHKGEHIKFKTEIIISPLCKEEIPGNANRSIKIQTTDSSAKEMTSTSECPTTGSYDVSSVVNKSSSTSAPDDPILPETSVTVAAETIGNSQNPESSPPSTTGTLVSTKTDPVPISVTSQTTVCSPEKPGQVASSGTPLDTSCCKGMASVSPLVSETSSQRISSEAKDNRYKKEMFGPESPLRRKGAEQAAKTIAGGMENLESPTLISIKRIDSVYRAEQAEMERRHREGTKVTVVPKTLSSVEEEDRPKSVVASYTVNVVGGVPQKVLTHPATAMAQGKKEAPPASPSILRNKKRPLIRPGAGNRRISCKDLGQGDCQGWLYKKKDTHKTIGNNWQKRWFVLTNQNIYYYKDPNDLKAQGVIHLPGFQVSIAPEIKKYKYAFKAYHTGTTFYFASDREDDRGKWMNKMGLAAIDYKCGRDLTDSLKASGSDTESQNGACYSESEDEVDDSVSLTESRRTHSPSPSQMSTMTSGSSTDDLLALHRSIVRGGVDLEGTNRSLKRIRRITRSEDLEVADPEELERKKKLASLDRTLKIKEQELEAIVKLLDSTELDTDSLKTFRETHPEVIGSLKEDAQASQLSLTSEDELQP